VVEGLQADLRAIGALGDETVAAAADRIAAAMGAPSTVRLLDLLAQAVDEVSAQLAGGRVEVHLAGEDVEFAVVHDEPGPDDEDREPSARITLRLSEALKARIETAAERAGVSTNTWVVRSLDRATRAPSSEPRPRVGRRLQGYGRS
jgi:predicted HicB family RNase H-like nuclease